MKIRTFLFILILLAVPALLYAQQKKTGIEVDYSRPAKYILGGVSVEGVKLIGEKQIIQQSGLVIGSPIVIPSQQTASAVDKLWSQRFFSNVSLEIDSLSAKRPKNAKKHLIKF